MSQVKKPGVRSQNSEGRGEEGTTDEGRPLVSLAWTKDAKKTGQQSLMQHNCP